jgi:major cell surface glycoprotein (TIGR04216 family)
MTDTQQKIKAVLLTVLMVTSVFAATIAFSGAAAAANRGLGDDTYQTGPEDSTSGLGDSSGDVGPGEVVFQGEEDIEGTFGSDNVGLGELQKVSGDNSGILLEQPIPQDQPTGAYSSNGETGGEGVTLQTPRITDVEVQNADGGDVTGSVLQSSTSTGADSVVRVDYNYEEAEDLDITIEDEDGLEVTEEVLAGSSTLNPQHNGGQNGTSTSDVGDNSQFDVGYALDTESIDEGQYTITVEGVEDLDFGDAAETVTVNITSDQEASLNLDNDEVTQGEDLGFDIEDSPEGNFHVVLIESSDFRDGASVDDAEDIFRNVGDVSDEGLVNTSNNNTVGTSGADTIVAADENAEEFADYAYAVVEIDGGAGVGSVETQYLDDSSIDIDLYGAGDLIDDGDHNVNAAGGDNLVGGNFETDDEQDFDVVEGEVSLDSPSETYVTGSEVDIDGTAAEGIDDVAIYARDNSDYELVEIDGEDTISVDGDNTFSEEDIQLDAGNEGGNDILSLPGTYRIGVVDTNDIGGDDPASELSTSNFNSNVSSTSSLRVLDTELNGTFTTYNGQIATDDEQVDVEGQAPGKEGVAVVFVGPRGNVVGQDVSVDDDDTFSEDDIGISDLNEGTVTAHIISSGRDNQFGEDGSYADAEDIQTNLDDDGTADQIRDRILSNTVDDTGSDDLIVNEQFRLSDGLTTIESISSPVEANGTVEVEGTTNRKPDDNTVTVEILNEEDESVTVDSTDEWGSDGQWSVSVDLSDTDVEPGNYTVESDDGDNTDRASVQIVEAGSLEEEQPETETPEPETEAPDTETETETEAPDTETEAPDTETEMDTEMTTEEPETTEASGPGFTAAIALIALIAAALLAVRRNN